MSGAGSQEADMVCEKDEIERRLEFGIGWRMGSLSFSRQQDGLTKGARD
jgi:hypothetical protein